MAATNQQTRFGVARAAGDCTESETAKFYSDFYFFLNISSLFTPARRDFALGR